MVEMANPKYKGKENGNKKKDQKKYKEGKKLREKIRRIKDCGISRIYIDKTFSNFERLKNTEVVNGGVTPLGWTHC